MVGERLLDEFDDFLDRQVVVLKAGLDAAADRLGGDEEHLAGGTGQEVLEGFDELVGGVRVGFQRELAQEVRGFMPEPLDLRRRQVVGALVNPVGVGAAGEEQLHADAVE